MFRGLAIALVLALSAAVGVGLYVAAGRGAPPGLSIDKPDRAVGQRSTIEVSAVVPRARLTSLTITLEQNGRTVPLFSLDAPQSAAVTGDDDNHLRVVRPFGKLAVPDLQAGSATIVVKASRKSLLNLRTLSASARKTIQVRLELPRVAVLSTHHYVNQGGSEMVTYRATPPDVVSGVRVGELEYRGFPAAGAGMRNTDPSVNVAFFALLHDQDLRAPIVAFARDEADNETKVPFVDSVFPKAFKRSRLDVDDRFFERTVPDIVEHSPELKVARPQGDLLQAFLKVNGELRRMNADRIIAITAHTSASRMGSGPFLQLGNSQVEASFADHRTYFYQGKEIDRQVHLGFDLAVTANVPVLAANAGSVLNASWLGIYGNCVIIDHGQGVASLYGHLSSFDVKAGDRVTTGQTIGKSGMTGLAGGDHLHFTMLVGGRPVNPVEWWDPHWIQDRIDRKLHELDGSGAGEAAEKATEVRPGKPRAARRQHR